MNPLEDYWALDADPRTRFLKRPQFHLSWLPKALPDHDLCVTTSSSHLLLTLQCNLGPLSA